MSTAGGARDLFEPFLDDAPYCIFTQAAGGRLDLARLLTQTRAFFEASAAVRVVAT